jgi:beta-glucosidase
MKNYRDRNLNVGTRVEILRGQMSLEEKVGQLNQFLYGWRCYRRGAQGIELTDEFKDRVRNGGQGALYGLFRADPWSGATFGVGLTPDESPKVANAIQRFAIENSRWGIPLLLSEECPHGHMALDGTIFPTNIGSACSWNPALYERAMQGAAAEIRARGAHLGLVSVLDMARDPRWGRTEETLGEDPFLSSQFAAAAVRGLQGPAADYFKKNRAAAVVKHAAAQGEASGGHNAAPSFIGDRELREIHLPSIRAAFGAGASAVMAAYNEIDGVACIGNRHLLTEVFRNEMGFSGMIMADGTAVDRLTELMGVSLPEAAAVALHAGVDLSLWDHAFLHLEESIQRGLVKMDDLDAAVDRVLALKFRLGLFDHPYMEENSFAEIQSEEHAQASLDLARESLVLLKNEGSFLPLSSDLKRIAVLGPNAHHIYNQLGDYTPPQRDKQTITLLDGIRAAASKEAKIEYRHGCGIRTTDRSELAEAVEAARQAEVAILCLGGASTREFGGIFDATGAMIPGKSEAEMDCGEGIDSASLRLPGCQEELFRLVVATGTPVVVVLVQGRPYAIPEIAEKAQAILAAWYPGQQGGIAVGEALFGIINPSGKLAISIPRSEAQLPIYYNYKPTSRKDYHDLPATPLYPFGFGLSYTQFAYSDLVVRPSSIPGSNKFEVAVTVKNEGNRAGAEVVQLYLRDKAATIVRRITELKAFRKITLAPGESECVRFEIGESELGFWNTDMRWAVEPGEFEVRVGGDSSAALNGVLTVNR